MLLQSEHCRWPVLTANEVAKRIEYTCSAVTGASQSSECKPKTATSSHSTWLKHSACNRFRRTAYSLANLFAITGRRKMARIELSKAIEQDPGDGDEPVARRGHGSTGAHTVIRPVHGPTLNMVSGAQAAHPRGGCQAAVIWGSTDGMTEENAAFADLSP